MSGTIDQWKARIGELRVQADLAKLDVREDTQKKVEIAENVDLASYSKFRGSRHDVQASGHSVRENVELPSTTTKKRSMRRRP